MTVFGNYARYYDLLYKDKDYKGEAQFIQQLLQTHALDTKSILELGCGTGNHAALLAQAGYTVHGVDRSEEMLLKARDRTSQLPDAIASRLAFSQGDIRRIRLEQKFDAIISLFHVISYQTSNEDLQAAFATVKTHLKPGGVFIFDCWYGPGVLSEPPTVRVKRLEDEAIIVTRIAEPVMYPNQNYVDVHYQVFIKDKRTGNVDELQETHQMRYLFSPEVELLLSYYKLNLLRLGEWMSKSQPNYSSWLVYFIAINI